MKLKSNMDQMSILDFYEELKIIICNLLKVLFNDDIKLNKLINYAA